MTGFIGSALVGTDSAGCAIEFAPGSADKLGSVAVESVFVEPSSMAGFAFGSTQFSRASIP